MTLQRHRSRRQSRLRAGRRLPASRWRALLTEHPLWSVGGAEVAWMVTMTLPSLLLFWLMRRMNAAAMTTRYVVAPLIANLIGLALLRPTVSLRAGLGLALIAAGAGWLLFARAGKQENTDAPQTLHLE